MSTRIVRRRPDKPESADSSSYDDADLDQLADMFDGLAAEAEAEAEAKPTRPDEPQDPAVVAARLVVLQVLEDPARAEIMRRVGSVVVVETPTAGWVKPIAVAWGEVVQQSAEAPVDGDRRLVIWGGDLANPSWIQYLRSGLDRSDKPDKGNEGVGQAILHHKSLVGFSPAPSRHLPADLVRAADLHVVVAPLDPVMLSTVAATVTGAPCGKSLDASVCRLIGPDALRLASRPNQTAEDYLRRVHDLVNVSKPRFSITLDDLAGMDAAVAWGRSLVADLSAYKAGTLPWSAVDRGVLLVGPPGCGKTVFAQALAATCDVPLILGSMAAFQAAGHLGDLLGAMRATFAQARASAPCILFLDEIDSVGDREKFSSDHSSYSTQVVNGLLQEMDGVGGRPGVVLVGATNNADRIDAAILRSGRLDRQIRIDLPSATALVGILRHHLRDDLGGADLSEAARLSLGGSGADVEKHVRGARRRARTEQREMVMDDLLAEIRGTVVDSDGADHWLACVHEGGHALAVTVLSASMLDSVSVRAVEGARGVTRMRDHALPTAAIIEARMVALLSGRAAERAILGEISSGAGGDSDSDLGQCTGLALMSIISFGLHSTPPVWYGRPEPREVEGVLHRHPKLAERVHELVAKAERRADELINEYRTELLVIAEMLRRAEVLSGKDVSDAIAECRRRLSLRSEAGNDPA